MYVLFRNNSDSSSFDFTKAFDLPSVILQGLIDLKDSHKKKSEHVYFTTRLCLKGYLILYIFFKPLTAFIVILAYKYILFLYLFYLRSQFKELLN